MPANRATLLALAERCEKAEGADPQLDADIAYECGQCAYQGNVTGSIDAAMTLVTWPIVLFCGPDCATARFRNVGDNPLIRSLAPTLPLAICAAALRALAETADE